MLKAIDIQLGLLVEAEWNANRVPPATLQKIRRSLQRFGVVEKPGRSSPSRAAGLLRGPVGADFIEETLVESGAFDAVAVAEVHADTARLRNFEEPETDDDVYDRLSDRVVEWSRTQDGPVPRQHDPSRSI